MTVDDPRWQRADGGWWHWPEGATGWTWIPDPPPAPVSAPTTSNKVAAVAQVGYSIGASGCVILAAVLGIAIFIAFAIQVIKY